VFTGAALAAIAAVVVYRSLPRHIEQHGAARGAVEAVEDVAELGIAGVPPVFADTPGDTDTFGDADTPHEGQRRGVEGTRPRHHERRPVGERVAHRP
jgi:hypothetical protein